MERSAQVIVVGGGPTGLMAALALASARVDTILVRGNPPIDNRTTALLASSKTALETLGVWSRCRAQAAPLEVMRIVDDTRRLWRAPEVEFSAYEIGLDAFGWNIENRHLLAALAAQAAEEPTLRIVFADALRIEISEAEVEVAISDGETLRGQLLVGADGHKSACRVAAGIEVTSRRTHQTAMTFNLAHTRPHHNASTEFHTERGPFTLVPLPGQRSSLVCVVAPRTADRMIGHDADELGLELEARAHSLLGTFTVEPGRGIFPLAVSTANRFAARRVALVGEAAHVLPPIGAQGLNLGLRDAAMVAQIAGDAARTGGDCGGQPVTQQYAQRRRADIASRTIAVDLLNRSLLTDFLPLQALRGLGLYALDRIGPLRRALMRAGVDAPFAPRLMRGHRLM
jgi:2-octaprenyl-6-methoxyphenol hydroxylase